MNISALKEFIDLAYTLNFRKSANQLGISPSALSKHISKLEEELSTQLFIRSKQSVSLTESGRVFYEKIKPIVMQLDRVIADAKGTNVPVEGTLRVGHFPIAANKFIGEAMRELSKEYPKVNVELQIGELGDMERALDNDVLDLCITARFSNSVIRPDMQFLEFHTDGLSAMIPMGNPLCDREYIEFRELMDYPLVLPDSRQFPDFYALMMDLIAKTGKEPNVVGRFSSWLSSLAMAASNKAIVVQARHTSETPPNVKCVDIINPEALIKIGVLWKTQNSAPGLTQFVNNLYKFWFGE